MYNRVMRLESWRKKIRRHLLQKNNIKPEALKECVLIQKDITDQLILDRFSRVFYELDKQFFFGFNFRLVY